MNHTERDEAVYQIVCDAAKNGKPCPTNSVIAEMLGCNIASASSSICRLERDGLISVRRQSGAVHRAVTITATGEVTADFVPQTGQYLHPKSSDRFTDAITHCGGRFEDHPAASTRRGRTIYAPTRVVQFSDCGISEVYAR